MVRSVVAFAATAALLSGHAAAARFQLEDRHANLAVRHGLEWDDECDDDDDDDDDDGDDEATPSESTPSPTPTPTWVTISTGTWTPPTNSVPDTTTITDGDDATTSGGDWVTVTVSTTQVHTISKCPETVTDCPYEHHPVTVTSTYPAYTTICPASEVPSLPTGGAGHGGDEGEHGGDEGEHGGDEGEHGGDEGEHGGDVPSEGGDEGEHGGDVPSEGGDEGEHGGDVPSEGGDEGEHGGDVPSEGGDEGEHGGDVPSEGGDEGEHGGDVPCEGGADCPGAEVPQPPAVTPPPAGNGNGPEPSAPVSTPPAEAGAATMRVSIAAVFGGLVAMLF